jgi:NAD-dependent deacetylase
MDEALVTAKYIEEAQKIAVLSGAGISTNAGIEDFRGEKGIYTLKKYDPYKTFDYKYFLIDQKPFYDFARNLINLLEKAQPTFTHKFFAQLEKSGKSVTIVTQNIDLLHERAGSSKIINLHGSIENSYCINCGKKYSLEEMKKKIFDTEVPTCDSCGGIIKPDVVFFEEDVKSFDEAVKEISSSDLLIIAGTSLEVYPAAMLHEYAKGRIVVVVKGLKSFRGRFDCLVQEDTDEFFRRVSSYLNEKIK